MRKTIILFALLLVAALQGVFAQITIFGSVVDAKDGSGIPGAYVTVKGTNIIGTTNSSGNFAMINVPDDAILQVSFTGYKTVEIPVENQTRFNITLELDIQALGEVVVTAHRNNQPERVGTAMGIDRDEKTLPYAVYQVSEDEIRKSGAKSIAEGLVGKIPGLQTYMGIDGILRISLLRGMGDKPPLFVLDGVPLREDPTDWLNFEDVESVTVLPSANATMLYGSEGNNGAIIITTKK